MLYYSTLPVAPKWSAQKKSFYYTESILSRFLGLPALQHTLPADNATRLNFVIYIPEPKHMPLTLYKDGSAAAWNAFYAPGWGAVAIHNLEGGCTDAASPQHHAVDTTTPFTAFMWYTRQLLDIPVLPYTTQKSVNVIEVWELERFMRRQLLRNMLVAADALSGITRLLEEITNMVVEDSMSSVATHAAQQAEAALGFMEQGKTFAAYTASAAAAEAAEAAFYDPSVLSLLYVFRVHFPRLLPMALLMTRTHGG